MDIPIEDILKINDNIEMRDCLIHAVKTRDDKIKELIEENKKLSNTINDIATSQGTFHYKKNNK